MADATSQVPPGSPGHDVTFIPGHGPTSTFGHERRTNPHVGDAAARLRVALADAAPMYRHAPEARAHRSAARTRVIAFMAETLPRAAQAQREFCADLLLTTISAVGKAVSEQGRAPDNVDAFATALGDMFCGYLASCAGATAKPKRPSSH